jgi:hypothetical protein
MRYITGTLTYALPPLVLVSSLIIGGLAYLSTAMCGESCGVEPGNFAALGMVIVVTAAVFLGAVLARARHLALGLMLLYGALIFFLIRMLESSSRSFELSGSGGLVLVPVVLAAGAVVCLYADVRLASDS